MTSKILTILAGGAVLAVSACASTMTAPKPDIAAAINAPDRSEKHVERDAGRMPADMIAFAGVEVGDTVLEFAPAGGYYTALLSRVVGPTGQIIGIGPERIFEVFPNGRKGFQNFIKDMPLENVSYQTANLDAVELPSDVDQVWMILYYHDTYWTGEDRAEMNRRIYEALRPGGTYFIIDHVGKTKEGDDITKSLHRMDPMPAKAEIEAAGFVLSAESDLLRNPDDPLDVSVFDEAWRGKTDRVVWKFVKP